MKMSHPSSSEKSPSSNHRRKGTPHGSNGDITNTPPSPRRRWIKLGGMSGRSRSVENIAPTTTRSDSPPLSLESPGLPEGNHIPVSPLDTPPKKTWEHNFRSFLSTKRSQAQHPSSSVAAGFPPVPLMAPLHHQQQQHQQQKEKSSPSTPSSKSKLLQLGKDPDRHNHSSVRGGKFFSSMFGGGGGGPSQKSDRRRKTKSLNELDSTMRKGQGKTQSPSQSPNNYHHKRVQSQANVLTHAAAIATTAENGEMEDELSKSRRRATYAGTTTGASIVPPPLQQPHHIVPASQQHEQFLRQQQQYHSTDYSSSYLDAPPHMPLSLSRAPQQQPHHIPYLPQQQQQHHQPYQYQYPHHHLIPPQQHLLPPQQYSHPNNTATPTTPNPLGPPPPTGVSRSASASSHSMSPSSATTEIKKAFTEFHNSSLYAKDSTSPYLGDEPSTRRGNAHYSMYNPGLVAQTKFAPDAHARNYSNGSIGSGSGNGHRFLSSSLPTVDENVSIHKSMRMLRPFQTFDNWQSGRRYLIGPAALAACPLLQGISSLSLSSASHTRGIESNQTGQEGKVESPSNNNNGPVMNDCEETSKEASATNENHSDNKLESPAELPPLFGCIVLGKALLSYVVSAPLHQHQQRWWSSSILILRQNYLLEYDQQTGDVLQGLPRGYAHLEFSKSYAHADFADALELEFFVSPCAKADKRVLTIRLEEAREKRDNWIACLNRAAQLGIKDLYEFEDSGEVGRGRYAGVYPAKRKVRGGQLKQEKALLAEKQNATKPKSLSSEFFPTVSLENCDCALKIINKKEFWSRVVKGRERADTLVRETSVQATMTMKCSKIPAFVRILGFFETSESVVLELELLEGMDLFQYVSSKGVLSEKESACILRDILTVLDGMNRAGLAHRDIKPANCLMCKTDETSSTDEAPCVVKVADFGMATFVGVDGLVRGRCGTPGYVAPEIFSAGLHGGYGNKVDVFSAGVTLYVMLCGYEPFYGESDADLVAANKETKLEFPSSDWKHVSPEAKELVKCMMEPDPMRRLSAKEALQHSWIVKHAGNTQSANIVSNTGLDSLSGSRHRNDEACIIS